MQKCIFAPSLTFNDETAADFEGIRMVIVLSSCLCVCDGEEDALLNV